ncbi:HD-GYP domain-containing protein [Jeotgalibacillus sp. R-1-5s-1]|uniref:HD-GYP domain-containing protein n=1 Tax=Jeotgalibacillus sp. R-1-5s-1 TaxID=2555897 RepID=UPI00106BFB9B|nr:HD-GYP domain-containing protein [Jeotgalibacillus sp. R-1-5s-1]TFD96555.1 HD-GYP domain-containing protein [Jeotgalibacillus sp. R-1-5s-1]
MKVHVEELTVGCIAAEDVMGLTANPIIKKGTEIEPIHIEVMRAFNIRQLAILSKTADGGMVDAEPSKDEAYNETADFHEVENYSFKKLYMDFVKFFNAAFNGWQSGSKVDVVDLKNKLTPLLKAVSSDRDMIYYLPRWSQPKDYMAHHAVSTALISYLIAEKYGYDKGACIQTALAGIIADTGMAKMPLSILKKTGPLTQEEAIEIRKHPIYSYQYVMDTPLLKNEMKQAIYQHHERLDGSGYPRGSKRSDINLPAQMIALADVYHAMTSERLYRARQSPFKALETIMHDEFGKFDIILLKTLQEMVGNLSTGTKVELSNEQVAEVIFTKPDELLRPMVRSTLTEEVIDLSTNRKLFIERVIS